MSNFYKNKSLQPLTLLSTLFCLMVISGCNSVKYTPEQEAKYVKPTVAVMSFENRAPVRTKWNLGDGLADQLIDRLMNTGRYVVLERQRLNAILTELARTEDKNYRHQGSPERGRLKHVRYLVKGTITDFGHVETVEGLWQIFDWGLLGSSSYTCVAGTIYVVDVQSGQIIASRSVEAKIRDEKEEKEYNYDGMAFGSHTFYHTPLGRATSKMLDEAVVEITQIIADQPFQPKIASFINDQVIINGGKDRRIKVGNEYLVRPTAKTIMDPDTGDILGHVAGDTLGRVRVTQVSSKYSIAQVIEGGDFEAGQTLFPVETQDPSRPVVESKY